MAIRLSELIWVFPNAVGKTLFNRIASSKSDEERLALTGQVHRTLLCMSVPLGAFAAASGYWIIPWLLGEKFASASTLLAVLIPGTVAFISFKVVTKYFGASGSPGLVSLAQAIGFLFAIVAYGVGVLSFGAFGAAVACSLTYAFTSAVGLVLIRRYRPTSKVGYFRVGKQDFTWFHAQFKNVFAK